MGTAISDLGSLPSQELHITFSTWANKILNVVFRSPGGWYLALKTPNPFGPNGSQLKTSSLCEQHGSVGSSSNLLAADRSNLLNSFDKMPRRLSRQSKQITTRPVFRVSLATSPKLRRKNPVQ